MVLMDKETKKLVLSAVRGYINIINGSPYVGQRAKEDKDLQIKTAKFIYDCLEADLYYDE